MKVNDLIHLTEVTVVVADEADVVVVVDEVDLEAIEREEIERTVVDEDVAVAVTEEDADVAEAEVDLVADSTTIRMKTAEASEVDLEVMMQVAV